jgi:hypothetical protein
MVKVYHNPKFLNIAVALKMDSSVLVEDLKADMVHVADVFTDDLDEAFEWTNNIDTPWTKLGTLQGNLKAYVNGPCRSTSVGDVMEKDGDLYLVLPAGFLKLL